MLWQSSREIHYSCGEMPYMHSLNLAIISIRYRSLWLFLSTASIPRRIFFHAFLSLLLKIRRSVPNDNTVVSEESRRTYDLGPCIYSWAVFSWWDGIDIFLAMYLACSSFLPCPPWFLPRVSLSLCWIQGRRRWLEFLLCLDLIDLICVWLVFRSSYAIKLFSRRCTASLH